MKYLSALCCLSNDQVMMSMRGQCGLAAKHGTSTLIIRRRSLLLQTTRDSRQDSAVLYSQLLLNFLRLQYYITSNHCFLVGIMPYSGFPLRWKIRESRGISEIGESPPGILLVVREKQHVLSDCATDAVILFQARNVMSDLQLFGLDYYSAIYFLIFKN